MPLKFICTDATMVHLNLRKQGPEEAPTRAVDMTMECEVDGAVLKDLLGAEEIPLFWFDSEDKDARYSGISSMKSWAQFHNHTFSFGGLRFRFATLKGFEFKPVGGRHAELKFKASVVDPTDREVVLLSELLKECTKLEVEDPGDLFDFEEEEQGDVQEDA